MGIKERREREREARRKSVLDATRSLVRERGYGGTTTRQIAEKCELSEAALFWHFQSKDEIFTSLLFEGIDAMGRGLDEIAGAELPPAERLAKLWRFFGRVTEEHPEYLHVFAHLATPQATASVSAEVKAEIARRSGDNFRKLAALLEGATGASPARVVADVLWAAFMGLTMLRDSRANLGSRPHPTRDDMSRALELLISGLAADARRR